MNKSWCETEEALLLFEIRNNIDLQIMSAYHKRTIKDIQSKILNIAQNMIENNISVKGVLNLTKLPEKVILNLYRKKNKKKDIKDVLSDIRKDISYIKSKLN